MTAATPAQPAPVSPHLGCAVCASGVTSPHGAGGTPGQAAYEAAAKWAAEDGGPALLTPWGALGDRDRDCWNRVAATVETEQLRLVRQDRDGLKRRVLDLAADLDISAAATRPSKKSTIEDELAIALRKLTEPVMTCDKCGNPVTGGTRCDGCRQLLADLEDK